MQGRDDRVQIGMDRCSVERRMVAIGCHRSWKVEKAFVSNRSYRFNSRVHPPIMSKPTPCALEPSLTSTAVDNDAIVESER